MCVWLPILLRIRADYSICALVFSSETWNNNSASLVGLLEIKPDDSCEVVRTSDLFDVIIQ